MRNLSRVFKALSDTNRIRILKMLEVRPLCVCEITDILNLATSTVSKHLSILRDAGLIEDEKDGKWVNYDLNREQNDEYARHLLPLMRTWLQENTLVLKDKEMAVKTCRETICGV